MQRRKLMSDISPFGDRRFPIPFCDLVSAAPIQEQYAPATHGAQQDREPTWPSICF